MTTAAAPISTEEGIVEGRRGPISIRDYTPTLPTGLPLVWVHGGAWIGGGLDQRESDAVARAIASTGRLVRTVDYALQPPVNWIGPLRLRPSASRYPVPRDEIIDVVKDLIAQSAGQVILGGASAGASLALSAAREIRGDRILRGLTLAYGTFHHRLPMPAPSLRSRLRGRHALGQFTPDAVRRMNLNYAGTDQLLRDAHVGGSDLTGLPPTLLIDADRDALRASSDALFGELTIAGCDVEQVIIAGSRHGFLDRPMRPAFASGIEAMTAWLESTASPPPAH